MPAVAVCLWRTALCCSIFCWVLMRLLVAICLVEFSLFADTLKRIQSKTLEGSILSWQNSVKAHRLANKLTNGAVDGLAKAKRDAKEFAHERTEQSTHLCWCTPAVCTCCLYLWIVCLCWLRLSCAFSSLLSAPLLLCVKSRCHVDRPNREHSETADSQSLFRIYFVVNKALSAIDLVRVLK